LESRLILDGAEGTQANLALEEALLRGNDGLLLRLWGNERSVIIGRAQLARFETDVERCAREEIPIVRRVTAGGAIYNGSGNINWSLFVGREFKGGGIRYTWGVREVFRMRRTGSSRPRERSAAWPRTFPGEGCSATALFCSTRTLRRPQR
jgi:lipoate-protein ligase A